MLSCGPGLHTCLATVPYRKPESRHTGNRSSLATHVSQDLRSIGIESGRFSLSQDRGAWRNKVVKTFVKLQHRGPSAQAPCNDDEDDNDEGESCTHIYLSAGFTVITHTNMPTLWSVALWQQPQKHTHTQLTHTSTHNSLRSALLTAAALTVITLAHEHPTLAIASEALR